MEFLKPRVTTDESFPRCGDVESPSAATPDAQTAVELPAATDLPRAAAIVAAAGADVGLYAIDFSDAYRYCVIHPSDRWTQCVLWADGVLWKKGGCSARPGCHSASRGSPHWRWRQPAIESTCSNPRTHRPPRPPPGSAHV